MGSLTLLVRPAEGQNIGTLNSLYRLHVGQVARNPKPATLSKPVEDQAQERGNLIVAGILQRSDKNGNRKIDRGEEPAWLKRSFDRVDANSDNALDQDELMTALKRLRR